MRLRLLTALRLLWGLLLLLALTASPLLALALLVVAVVLLQPFCRKKYGHPSVTLRGEVVRSSSEKVIADWLFRRGIRYVYEHPVLTRDGSRMTSRPDFYLPDFGVYVEYWGLVGVSMEYERRMKSKLGFYARNGTKVISLYPGELNNLDSAFRFKLGRAVGTTS